MILKYLQCPLIFTHVKDEDMKTNILFLLMITMSIFGVVMFAFAQQPNNTPPDRLMSGRIETEKGQDDPSVEGSTTTDLVATWGLHEPLKGCVPCHGKTSEQITNDTFSLIKEVPELCYACHERYTTLGAWVHGPVATGECLLCHEPHTSNNKLLLKKPIPELCYLCHKTSTLRLVADHSNESYTRCNDCHVAHTSPGRMLLTKDFLKTDAGLVYVGKNLSAQPQLALVDCRDSLYGLKGVEVIPVIDGLELFKRYGASVDLVKAEVERQLRRKGIKILRPQEQSSKRSSLYVHLRLMEVPSFHRPGQVEVLSGSFNLFFQQMVELLPTPGDAAKRYCKATTWDTGAIMIWGTSQIEEGLKEAVEVLVGQFSKDYLEANPDAQVSARVSD